MPYFLLAFILIVSATAPSASSQSGDTVRRHAFPVASLFPSSTCPVSSAIEEDVDRESIPRVIHQDSPCGPLSSNNDCQDLARLFRLEEERVVTIQSKLSGGIIKGRDSSFPSGNVSLPANSGIKLGVLNYVVKIGLGTPPMDLTLAFDTGSDLTWTQCQPCARSCYNQVDEIFDPSRSSSYANVSCTSTTCTQIASGTASMPSCPESTCVYGQLYNDNSYTFGFYGTERLTLSPKDVIDNFLFGCGQNNSGIYGMADGLLGLGRGNLSLVVQTASHYGQYFSYCLPDTSSSSGYLNFGNNGNSSAAFTPMLTLSYPTYYGIDLVGISVGMNQLSISPSIFSNAGTIIDSGTAFTHLPQTAYDALRDAFRQEMSNYPMASPNPSLDTCYDLSNYDNASIPSVTFTFGGGVRVNLVRNGIVYTISRSQVCLAFQGNGDDSSMGIFGSTQQRLFKVIYDIPRRQIGFAPNGC
ncbi:hypothetical protein MLD38_006411 [Melastoma candidum]|uniref:Uncharacterized protein n=1 Tax=Melastoma candidum TaxID=119954 RepID=A0ACB9RP02_9MYRT|nr:hypothetical protein MLD38_006411 [Melastoma candidum]